MSETEKKSKIKTRFEGELEKATQDKLSKIQHWTAVRLEHEKLISFLENQIKLEREKPEEHRDDEYIKNLISDKIKEETKETNDDIEANRYFVGQNYLITYLGLKVNAENKELSDIVASNDKKIIKK